jgi:hypothetical protein
VSGAGAVNESSAFTLLDLWFADRIRGVIVVVAVVIIMVKVMDLEHGYQHSLRELVDAFLTIISISTIISIRLTSSPEPGSASVKQLQLRRRQPASMSSLPLFDFDSSSTALQRHSLLLFPSLPFSSAIRALANSTY